MTLHANWLSGDTFPAHVSLRPADVDECAKGGMTPYEALVSSIRNSDMAYEVRANGETIAWWGFASPSLMSSVVHGWMLTTPIADQYKIAIARESIRVMKRLFKLHPTVLVTVDPCHNTAMNWLEWLGFRLHASNSPFLTLRADKDQFKWAS